ncbi:unnamed protein product [Adineta ricciae]|uniref:Uncharacterized protein n=1 Tax=Adineta ricciae TaxID=249248 RepID=A0A814BZ85_ADIRI|nr:unnamed protein product [Adineta ricciae]CAF1655789.1 unnamed protein product [Adineta ricciae]
MLLAAIVTSVLLFVFIFPLQAQAFESYMADWLSWLISFFVTLFETGVSVLVISSLFLACYMDVIFDSVWRQETMGLNEGETHRKSATTYTCIKSFLTLILFRVVLLVVTSPLNLIPIIGTILYIYINGYYYAWSLHCRYFDLLGLSFLQGRHFVEENRNDYTQFGIVGILLEMIPFLNLITPVTNVIGSALWACDIERYKEPTQHPRSYLLAPTPEIVEQGQATGYGSIKNEKEPYPMEGTASASALPPTYQDVIDSNNLYPSAPPLEKQ